MKDLNRTKKGGYFQDMAIPSPFPEQKEAPRTPRPSRRRYSEKTTGAALILVLASLVFLTVLIVAFLMSMRTKVLIAKAGADHTTAQMLADTSVALVISQVRDATLSATNGIAWASQPGMIRLYKNNGQPDGFRKLYSWNPMNGDGAFHPFDASEQVPGNWASQFAIYTDLNAPARGVYPILDFQGAQNLQVKNFSLEGSVPGATSENPAPMPVQWLYVLADGTLHPPDAGSQGTKAVISSATKSNPIVGRIAFWTDDESAKININTASEGTFWATPRFGWAEGSDDPSKYEGNLARSQPARNEFQRYPGHPAGVSLKSVFPHLDYDEIYQLVPRISQGGSENGTKPFSDLIHPITTDEDRLYASVDELIFKNPSNPSDRASGSLLSRDDIQSARFFLTATSRSPELNLFGQPRIAIWPIHAINHSDYRTANDRLLAFCSTIGQQPFYFVRQENFLPTHDISILRNHELLNYLDGVTGKNIPGFGGNFWNKYTQEETRQILTEIFDYIRCTNLFDATTKAVGATYPSVFGLSSRGTKGVIDAINGAGLASAAPAWRKDWNTRGFGGRWMQIIEARLHFVALGEGAYTEVDGEGNPVLDEHGNPKTHGAVDIDPNQFGDRINMLDENGNPISLDKDRKANTPPPNNTAIQAYLTFTLLTPGEGIQQWCPGQWMEVEGLDQFSVKQSPEETSFLSLGFPAKGRNLFSANMLGGAGVNGARINLATPFALITHSAGHPKTLNPDVVDKKRFYPFYSQIIPVKRNASALIFSGGRLTVRFYAEKPWAATNGQGGINDSTDGLVQEFTIDFPGANLTDPEDTTMDGTFPMPRFNPNGIRRIGSIADGVKPSDADPSNPYDRWLCNFNNRAFMVDNNFDVLRSVGLSGAIQGDVRLLINPANATTSLFRPLTHYNDPSVRIDQDGSVGGKLVENAAYVPTSAENTPFVPAGINGVRTSSGALGDWDNGTSVVGDGPFINAADPGSVTSTEVGTRIPYYGNAIQIASYLPALFSPNRQLPSPVMFGSLSTGVRRGLPWQTLLFRPGPPNHPGMDAPRDHLLLDLFWMPTVEPYAISEPFSTAGKINLNQQIVPFTYIQRMTGLDAILNTERIAKVRKDLANTYKRNYPSTSVSGGTRFPVNLSTQDGALRQFKEKFASGELFRSLTEICDIYLPPSDEHWTSDANAQTRWYSDDFALVGDNTRERPYADIYNRVTTKSNVFTVYYTVEVLRQTPGHLDSDPTVFDPSAGDQIRAEQRGSISFERYLDPNDVRFQEAGNKAQQFLNQPSQYPDFSFEPYYRTRILFSKIFNP